MGELVIPDTYKEKGTHLRKIEDFITKRKDLTLFACVVLFLVVVGATSFVTDSLWLDEGITYWVTAGSLKDVIHRTLTFQGQSPFYYGILWGVRQLGFESEFLLRLPSIIAVLLSALLLISLSRRFVSYHSSVLAALMFLSTSPALRALSARPYALALLFTLLSWWGFFYWVDTRKKKGIILFVCSLVLSFYAHYLFILSALLPLLWFLIVLEKERRSYKSLLFITLSTILLALPGLFQMWALHLRRESLFFSPSPTFARLMSALFPFGIIVSVFAGALLTRIFQPNLHFIRVSSFEIRRIFVLSLTFVVPPLLYFTYSMFGTGSLFNERYFLWSFVPFSIIIAWCVDMVAPQKVQFLLLLVICIFLTYAESARTWHLEQWREAAVLVRSKVVPVLLSTGLVESSDLEWLEGEETSRYLQAPFAPYPLATQPLLVPARAPGEAEKEYVRQTVRKALSSGEAFFVYLAPLSSSAKSAIETASMELAVSRETLQKGVVTVERLTLEKK